MQTGLYLNKDRDSVLLCIYNDFCCGSRWHQRQKTSTLVGDQHPLRLSQVDLMKIAELAVRQLLTNNNAAQTTAAALVPPFHCLLLRTVV